jgi:nucleoside-diphosphate-sugar epimerase
MEDLIISVQSKTEKAIIPSQTRIVVFGSGGFIGTQLLKTLRQADFDVWGITRHSNNDTNTLCADLLDQKATEQVFQKLGKVDVVIHLAALSNGAKPPVGYTLESVNITITKNIINAVNNINHFIYFSSISVYGEDGRNSIVKPTDELRPASLYGIGKKECEKMIIENNYPITNIFRPAPVYSEKNLRNISMRVYFPYTKIKIKIIPSPSYSFCHVDRACNIVLQTILNEKQGNFVTNLADKTPHFQISLIDQFPGLAIPVFSVIFLPFYWLFKIIPGIKGYKLRCLWRKLFSSCLYDSTTAEL